jgi:imidazolonepropionase-like amidohydrolase
MKKQKDPTFRVSKSIYRQFMSSVTTLFLLIFSASSVRAVDPANSPSDHVPAKPQERPIALIDGTIHPISSPEISNATILFDKGKIVAIGANVQLPPNTEKINISGKHVYPGMIEAYSQIGLVEIGAVRATRDLAEAGTINPNARAEVAVNPESERIPVTRVNGVLIAHVTPQGGLLSGRSAAMMLDGWTWEDMTLKAPVGIIVNWPRMTVNRSPRAQQSEEEQKKVIEQQLKNLKLAVAEARRYALAKKTEAQRGMPHHPFDARWEAMRPVFDGALPVFVNANEIKQIQAAVDWAAQENLKLVIVGGKDSWRAADLLKRKDIPVIVGPIHDLPMRDWEDYDTAFTVAKKLQEAGVRFCISGGSEMANERNLPYQAATAAAYGLPKDEAMKAITLYPAQILGIDERAGSLEAGKDATLFISSGDPLETFSHVEAAYIQGRLLDLRNRHRQLYEKYQEKYLQLKAGQ